MPLRSEPGEGSDPHLSEQGLAQAARLPDALSRFSITRLVSSPQRRAIQTAGPLADKLGLEVGVWGVSNAGEIAAMTALGVETLTVSGPDWAA